MFSFCRLALLALSLCSALVAAGLASPTPTSIYSSAQEAFQDLLNALPEESLQAALSGLKDFKNGVFESHHRGIEQVHDKNPALATKLIVAAVQDLKKRQTFSNSTAVVPPPVSSPQVVTTTTDRAVIIDVPQTTTDSRGQTIVETTSILSQVTASVAVTLITTNSQGQTVTATENRPAVIRTTTDAQGRTTVTTSAADFAPTAGEIRTETDGRGSTFLTTYTPGGGKISSVKLITTTGSDGQPSTLTSYTFVDPAQATQTQGSNPTPSSTKTAGLQNGAANINRARDFAVMGGVLGGAFAMFV